VTIHTQTNKTNIDESMFIVVLLFESLFLRWESMP